MLSVDTGSNASKLISIHKAYSENCINTNGWILFMYLFFNKLEENWYFFTQPK